MSEIINENAQKTKKKMPKGARIAIIIVSIVLALAILATVAFGALLLLVGALIIVGVAVGAVLMFVFEIDMQDIAYVFDDFFFFLDGYYNTGESVVGPETGHENHEHN